ncbi:MAG: SAM-dependent methyltransferase [Verrucomicrobia bacterium]|nr:SAM-dependent methyltransferase [Verrucomicrobiota bacterium]
MTPAHEVLRREIQRDGPVSFARFMDQALYHPRHGYYERQSRAIGTAGDFYTSPATGPLFGHLMAAQFAHWLDTLPPDRPLHLVEAGAHDGRFAADVLDALGKNRPTLARRVLYWIIEPSSHRQSWQRKTLRRFRPRIQWFPSPAHLPPSGVTGVFFSNELIDAFPIERFGWNAKRRAWFEWRVDCTPAGFAWHPHPVASPHALERRFCDAGLDVPEALRDVLPDGFTLELRPAAASWWRSAAAALHTGTLLTLDYGLTASEFLDPRRPHGTLRAYRAHRLCPDPLAHPGEQDLTAHVNFTELQTVGELAGLVTTSFLTQSQFLTRIAEQLWHSQPAPQPWTPSQVRQFQTLTHPNHMGHAFRVLVQTRLAPGSRQVAPTQNRTAVLSGEPHDGTRAL